MWVGESGDDVLRDRFEGRFGPVESAWKRG